MFMHSIFYRYFKGNRFCTMAAAFSLAFLSCVLLGCYCYQSFPAGDADQCRQLVQSQARLLPSLLCGVIPLLMGAILYLAPNGRWLSLLAPAYSGFLIGYSASMFVYELGWSGWLLGSALFLGRCLGLGVLFWFLSRRIAFGRKSYGWDLAMGCCLSWILLLLSDQILLPRFLSSVLHNFL